jgi:hypothetical protein
MIPGPENSALREAVRPAARPSSPAASARSVAECANCERSAVFVGNDLPAGWATIRGEALCPDCAPPLRAPPEEPARATDARGASGTGWRRASLHTIGAGGSQYRGCRVGHEFAFDRVGLRIHAGTAVASDSRDEPVQFTVDVAELDELVRHLSDIRKELGNG